MVAALCLLPFAVGPACSQGILTIAPSSGAFGGIAVGATSPAVSFTLTNDTAGTTESLVYTNLGEFDVRPGTCQITNGQLTLNPGQSCDLSVLFKPTLPGPVSGTLSIQTAAGTFNLPLSGIGAALVISPTGASFGTVAVGATSPALSFTVTNYTSAPVTYDDKRGSPSFKVQPGTCHLNDGDPMVASGASCMFTAEFVPTASGAVTGTLQVSTNLGPVVFPMSGTGLATTPASYSESVLYSFCSVANCADGSTPFASLVQDAAGNLYGTTLYGGTPNEYCGVDCGTVFKIDTTGHETVLHSFNPICTDQAGCSDGFQPFAGLLLDAAGNLYGTTLSGGTGIAANGVVFKLDNTGRETVLYNFCSADNCADGSSPYAGLVQDAAGNLYGTTNLGGVGATPCSGRAGYNCSGGAGNVFKVDATGRETVLYGFCSVGNCADGSHPYFAGVSLDSAGNLYGTTYVGGVGGGGQCGGGSGCGGTAFKLDTTGHETVLHSFCSVGYYCDDGDFPQNGVVRDAPGNLYGTTGYGGSPSGGGTVFKVDSTGNQTVLYDFCSAASCADGFRPLAGLIQDPAGNLYGTTYYGGTASSSCPNNSNNCGTVFKLDSAGNETVLYSFCSAANCADGSQPQAGLIQDAAGNLYGTTRLGGAYGKGTVFKLTPKGTASGLLAIAPSSGSFGYVPVGTASPEISFTLTNNTTSTVEELAYTNLTEFSVRPGTCHIASGELMLNPGKSCTLEAVFKPTAPGPVSGTLSIQTASGAFNLPLSGTGAALVISPSSAAFGTVAVGTTSPALSFTVTNYTSAAAVYDDKRGSPSFKVQSGTCHLNDGDPMVASGASCTFTAEFAPAASGTVTGTLQISTNLGPAVFPMSGTGTGTPVSYGESVLYSFCSLANCADGSYPTGGLIRDAEGNLYGPTGQGGANGPIFGTVFKVDNTGRETVLYSFCSAANCADGTLPDGGLIRDAAGNLYGTTHYGGAGNGYGTGFGTVFKVDNTGHETVLHTFAGYPDGAYPDAGLVQDAAGNLYGTTTLGGDENNGTVFKIDSAGHETVLYNFGCNADLCANGISPQGVISDAAGNLYGTTASGGLNNGGTVFKLDSTGRETVLYSFCSAPGCADGNGPQSGLIQDAAGNLYGTTAYGGDGCPGFVHSAYCGTVFKLDNTGHETVLYNFCSAAYCTDGSQPQAGLIQDDAGNLYGTTVYGGANCAPTGGAGCGTVFKVDSAGHETVLHSFCSAAYCADGNLPTGGLIQDAAGNLYGATSGGGPQYYYGVVFKLTPRFN